MKSLVAALAGLVASGVLILVAGGRVWSTATLHAPGGSTAPVSVTGHAVEPALPAMGVALLALAAAVIAARGRMRRAVGFVIMVVGGFALGVSIAGRGAVSSALTSHEAGGLAIPVHGTANGWWVVALVGAVLAEWAGVGVVVFARQWAAMGRKYEAPQRFAAPQAGDPADIAWDALDRGEDPTE